MPPRKGPPAQPASAREENVDRLAKAVEELTQEVHVLTAAIDDIRQELEWTMKEIRADQWLSSARRAPQPAPEAQLPAAARESAPPLSQLTLRGSNVQSQQELF